MEGRRQDTGDTEGAVKTTKGRGVERSGGLESKYDELLTLLGDPNVQADPSQYRTHAKALAEIESVVEKLRE